MLLCLALMVGAAGAQTARSAPAGSERTGPWVASRALNLQAPHPRVVLGDAEFKAQLLQRLKARTPAAGRFEGMVNSQMLGTKHYNFEPWYAALMGQLSGMEAPARLAVEMTDAFVAQEEALIQRGERPRVAFDSYLYVGEHIGNLALVYDWCHALLTPSQKARWVAYANQAVNNVWNPRTARWGSTVAPWTGWSVDNPANNYYYSFLRATMLLGLATMGENPLAESWLQMFRQTKIELQLLPTFERDLQGGGSREGTGYGTALKGLFILYDWWHRSTGEKLHIRTGHTLASMAHLLHSTAPTLDRLAPTGDHARDASAKLFDYHREYLLLLMALFPEHALSRAAGEMLEQSSVPRMRHGFSLYLDFLYEPPPAVPGALQALATSYWGPGTGQLMMRSAWNKEATFANFICGPNTESHAHRDQGSFVLFKRDWLALDANLYSRSGLDQQEEAHNLVRFEQNGQVVKQTVMAACELQGLVDAGDYVHASARITPAYRGKPQVAQLEREFFFLRPNTVVVFDRAAAAVAGVRRVWSLNLPAALTPATVAAGDPWRLREQGTTLELHRLWPQNAEVSWVPMSGRPRADRSDASLGVRLDVAHAEGVSSQFLTLLSLDGAARQVERADAPGMKGVRWQTDDGRSVMVQFHDKAPAGRVEIRSSAGAVLHQGPLATQVQAPPLLNETPRAGR